MPKFNRIAVLNTLNLPQFAQDQIQQYSQNPVDFSLDDSASEDESIQRIGDSQAVLGSWDCLITSRILDACESIKYIGICGTSLTRVDVQAVESRGIVLKNVTDYGDEATAEYIFAQLLSLARGLGKYQWRDLPCELYGKSLGIIGLGAVGQQVARLALGFNMKTSYYSRSRHPDWEQKGLGYQSLDDLLSSVDIVCLCIPRNLMTLRAREFSLMRSNSILVNTAIGSVFDLADFIDWIKAGNHFAIIDNQSYIDEIKDLPNVIALPISAGKTQESIDRLGQKVVENIHQYFESNNA